MPEPNLYLVFDDWESGYSIRKVSLDPSKASSGPSKGAKQLPVPPVFMRIEAPRGFPELFTSAFGPKIIMMHPSGDEEDDDPFAPVPTINVHDQTVTFKLQPNTPAAPIYIPVGEDRLYALDIATFEVLSKPECSGQPWLWQKLTSHPFWIGDVSSYCLQPDGCILVSTKKSEKSETFIFDTKDCVWKKCGDWAFPFAGRGHYDSSLKGFVGVSKEGYLYCCTIASTATGLDTVKALRPKGNQADKGQLVSATLVHMSPGEFCLVECVSIGKRLTDEELDHEIMSMVPTGADIFGFMGGGPQDGRSMYCLKTFSLRYDRKGDLKLENSKVYRYSLPSEAKIGTIYKDPVAFWL